MNFEQTKIHSTEKQEERGRDPKRAELILIGAIHLLLSFYLPTALFFEINEIILKVISLAVAAFAVFAFARLSRASRSLFSYVLVLAACFMMLGSAIGGFVAATIGSAYILSYMLIYLKKPLEKLIAFLPVAISYLIAVILLSDPLRAALALIHVPASILLAYAVSRKLGRISTICHTSVGIILSFCAISAVAFISRYGTDFSMIQAALDSARLSFIDVFSEAFYTVYSEIGYELTSVDMENLATVIVNTTFNLLPAIVIIISNIIAFLLQSMIASAFLRKDMKQDEIRELIEFNMSTVSAIVFLSSFLIATIFSKEISVWSVTAENIALILMPGLIFTSIIALRSFIFGRHASCFGVMAYFFAILLFFYIPSIMFTVASFAGAVVVILNNIAKAKLNKKK